MLSQKALEEFKQVYLDEYGEQVSDEEATELGINLLMFFHHIYRPQKKSGHSRFLMKKNLNKT